MRGGFAVLHSLTLGRLDDLNSAAAANHTDFSVLRQETSELNISE
jgi:hypothetical protein